MDKIDAFQGTLIRNYVLNIKWPKIATNEQVYTRTKMKKWSDETGKKRLNGFRKVIRMNENTPAKLALRYALEKYKRPKGKPPTTWISTIKKDRNKS